MAKQVDHKFVETGGHVKVRPDHILVRFDKRSHNPILRGSVGQGVPSDPLAG
jgi:hypothetical protein